MKFSMNKSGIKLYKNVLNKRVMYVEKKFITYLWRTLYIQTPLDTGAARSSWNISINTPNYSWNPNKKTNSLKIPNYKINDTLIISSGCPYMKVLNDGWSKQAPKNFIQISILNSKRYIDSLNVKDIN